MLLICFCNTGSEWRSRFEKLDLSRALPLPFPSSFSHPFSTCGFSTFLFAFFMGGLSFGKIIPNAVIYVVYMAFGIEDFRSFQYFIILDPGGKGAMPPPPKLSEKSVFGHKGAPKLNKWHFTGAPTTIGLLF